MKIKFVFVFIIVLFICLWQNSAEAARQFTVTQTNPVPGTQFDMGTTQSITFQVTNTCNGGNAGERLYQIRLRLPGTGTTFSAATAAPAGWTRTAYSTTSVTFQATSWANSIISGSSLNFTLVMVMRTTTADVNETLRDARASFTLDTNFGNGITRTGRVTNNNPGSWSLKSLSITSFQTYDATCTTPVSAIVSGTNFCLRMAITNISSATQNSIITNTNPPTATKTGTVTQTLLSTTYNPSPLTLAPGASGTITFMYSTVCTLPSPPNPCDNGTIYFTANARNNTNSATSRTATSNTLVVSRINVGISVVGPVVASPTCIFTGDTATFTMTVTNNSLVAITNVTPSALTQCAFPPPCIGTITIGALTGPVPACIASIVNGATGTFTWTATITGTINNPKSNFSVTGNVNYNKAACGAGGGTTSVTGTSTLEDLDGYVVNVAPASTNASSTNQEIVWSVQNLGCEVVNSVSITIPAGWTWTGGDSYSLVGNADIETWTVAGANPVVFTADVGNQLPKTESGTFNLVFPTTPTAIGNYTFNITITDANATPIAKTIPTTVTVNPFNTSTPGQGNYTNQEIWRESY